MPKFWSVSSRRPTLSCTSLIAELPMSIPIHCLLIGHLRRSSVRARVRTLCAVRCACGCMRHRARHRLASRSQRTWVSVVRDASRRVLDSVQVDVGEHLNRRRGRNAQRLENLALGIHAAWAPGLDPVDRQRADPSSPRELGLAHHGALSKPANVVGMRSRLGPRTCAPLRSRRCARRSWHRAARRCFCRLRCCRLRGVVRGRGFAVFVRSRRVHSFAVPGRRRVVGSPTLPRRGGIGDLGLLVRFGIHALDARTFSAPNEGQSTRRFRFSDM